MNLSSLTIGSLTLDPTFSPDVDDYEAYTLNATNKITAVAEDEEAEITILVNGEEIENETSATWDLGLNSISIKVVNHNMEKYYTVHIYYYPEVEFEFSPTELTADETDGLSSDTVTMQGTDTYNITVDSVISDNEHITGVYSEGIITVTCDDDTILTDENLPITVTVRGHRDENPAVGTFEITYSGE